MDGLIDRDGKSEASDALIRLAHSDEIFRCKPGRSLLFALNSIAPRVAEGCRGGGCGVCRVRILSGEAVFGRMSVAHISPAAREMGWTLACRTFPATDMLIAVKGSRRIC